MTVLEFSDAHHFLDRAGDTLLKSEVANNLLLSAALALSKRHARARFLAVTNGNAVVAAALRTPQKRWMVAGHDEVAATHLSSAIDARLDGARSLLFPVALASSFAMLRDLKAASSLNFMSVSRLKPVAGAGGLVRSALPRDLKTLKHWSQASAQESGIDESPSEAADIIEKYLEHKQLFVWENDGGIKAMAATGGFTPRSVRISQVYTDPNERGRGYAATLVHRLSHRLLSDRPGSSCVLLADAKNLTTKHIYEKIGYATISTYAEHRRPHGSLESAQSDGFSVTTTG